jgi:hypothetical protein
VKSMLRIVKVTMGEKVRGLYVGLPKTHQSM